MTTLYGCKKTQDRETFLIAKFDENLVIQKSYFVGPKTCQCEGWQRRNQCKHLTIRTLFMMNGHTCDGHFLDFDNRTWREYPQLAQDGTIGEPTKYRERYDGLAIGDKGYQTAVGSASAVGAEGVNLSSPAPAPGVEQGLSGPPAPPGAQSLSSAPQSSSPVIDGIKRRRGL